MYKRISIKNHYREIQLVTRRTMLMMVIICTLVALLVARLAYLQIYKNELYTTLSTQNAIDLIPVEPTRGLIYDRNGILLAENVPVFSLDIIPQQVNNLETTLANLRKIIDISDDDITQFKKQLKQRRRFDEIPLKLRLTDQEVARFAENQYRFPGVLVKGRLMRHYPFGEAFSHVLGYVGRINAQELNEIDQVNYSASHYIGKLGIEKYYEDELHGQVGYEEVENDASGKAIRTIKTINGEPGRNLYLTLDSKLQLEAEKALMSKRGAVVAIQPETGQVLAMVSQPGFDPSMFVLGISQQDYQALQKSEDKPLYDRALRGLYPLASTIKPYLALEGLQSGTVTEDYTIWDTGTFKLPNSSHIFHDWKKHGHGHVNLPRAITVSCDIYFYNLAAKMGIQRMAEILKQFGYGALTGIDLEGELPGNVPTPEWKQKARGMRWYPGDTIISSIGQGDMQATPLQLANAVAAMANHGKRFMPYLLLGAQLPGQAYEVEQPIELESVKLADDKYWDIVIKAMQEVVTSQEGTGYATFGHNYGYTIAGKTGTAAVARRRVADEEDKQDKMPEKLRDHRLFIAFAPIDHPKIALAIVTENSNIAIETAKDILDYYLGTQKNAARPVEVPPQKARV